MLHILNMIMKPVMNVFLEEMRKPENYTIKLHIVLRDKKSRKTQVDVEKIMFLTEM